MDGDRSLSGRVALALAGLTGLILLASALAHLGRRPATAVAPSAPPTPGQPLDAPSPPAVARAAPASPTAAPAPSTVAPAPVTAPPGGQPHPITRERLRIEDQHRLFDHVEAAIEAGAYQRARALLETHRTSFSEVEAWTDVREGWLAIADCLQNPGPTSAARGRRFVDEERGSALRRRVRRACLEP